jgi:nucleoside-diphosphate-sugar epimerase
MSPKRIVVLGAKGFVGSAVVRWLKRCGDTEVVAVSAPRYRSSARDAASIGTEAASNAQDLVKGFQNAEIVVNAAGIANAAGADLGCLVGANACLPTAALLAAERTGVRRFIHVSSAAVQGRHEPLDESTYREPSSPYTMSKCLGEEALLGATARVQLVVYRPASVHGPDRQITRRLASVARSPLASVAGAGDRPTPQALVDNVGAAVAHLCMASDPPRIVLHPWEGLTTGDVVTLLGDGRIPRHIPESVARFGIRGARVTGGAFVGRVADIRRVELLWFGQEQAMSWLTKQGWLPPVGREGWLHLAAQVQRESA